MTWEDWRYGLTAVGLLAVLTAPPSIGMLLLACRLDGWRQAIPWKHAVQLFGMAALVVVSYGQTTGGWAQQIENRVRTLEEWRELHRDMLARQQDTNDRTAAAIEKLARITEEHERRLNEGEKQRALIINTGETMVRVGGWAIVLVPLLAAILNAMFNYWLLGKQSHNGGSKIR